MASSIAALTNMATNAASSASQAAQTTNSTTSSASSSNSSSSSSAGGTQQISESTFLQLLVAQLQNQDPMQPMDGMQFVTQLAQFSQLESTYGIQSDTDQLVANAAATGSTATGSTTGTTGS